VSGTRTSTLPTTTGNVSYEGFYISSLSADFVAQVSAAAATDRVLGELEDLAEDGDGTTLTENTDSSYTYRENAVRSSLLIPTTATANFASDEVTLNGNYRDDVLRFSFRGEADIASNGGLTNGEFTSISFRTSGTGTISRIDDSRNTINGAFFGSTVQVLAGNAEWQIYRSISRNLGARVLEGPPSDIPSGVTFQLRVGGTGAFFLER
jgi:hypothetical protein